jgi:ferredoxin/flavodoxin---NADP+ reductase
VIGVGNVAMDVVRILARTPEELREPTLPIMRWRPWPTATSSASTSWGGAARHRRPSPTRRSRNWAKWPLPKSSLRRRKWHWMNSQAFIDSGRGPDGHPQCRNSAGVRRKPPQGKDTQIVMRFLVSPVEIIGTIKWKPSGSSRTNCTRRPGGSSAPARHRRIRDAAGGLVFRSVGYRGVPLPDVPFMRSGARSLMRKAGC